MNNCGCRNYSPGHYAIGSGLGQYNDRANRLRNFNTIAHQNPSLTNNTSKGIHGIFNHDNNFHSGAQTQRTIDHKVTESPEYTRNLENFYQLEGDTLDKEINNHTTKRVSYGALPINQKLNSHATIPMH